MGRETQARQQFVLQGFTVYLPLEMRLRKHARRQDKVARAYFSGYLFLGLSPDERQWTRIRSTREAIEPVHFGAFYPPVPEQVIAALKGLEGDDGYICAGDDALVSFKSGDRVVVSDGQFSGVEGVFVCKNGQERAMVLLGMLQRQVKAEVSLASLSSA